MKYTELWLMVLVLVWAITMHMMNTTIQEQRKTIKIMEATCQPGQ